VMVNGVFTLEKGELTWKKPGIVILNPHLEN
jgi:hypothetical protein